MTLSIQQEGEQEQPETWVLDFILSHLSSPIFPRKISIYESKDSQFTIDNRDRVLTAYRDSNFRDCRINAYPLLREGKSWVPDLFFIDLDLADFQSEKSLDIVLSKTLRNISKYLGKDTKPTVLWSGNGYHVIQPVECPVTDYLLNQKLQEFADSRIIVNGNPAEEFLRFAKILLSDNKADRNHNPSFRSCLLRVPGTINSKNNRIVKIVQEWNGYRPTITKELFIEFNVYLIQKKIDYDLKQGKKWKGRLQKQKRINGYHNNNYGNYYDWIDELLETGLEDCRKLVTDLILAPYLIKVKNLSFKESFQIIREWLDKCDNVRTLDNSWNFNYRIKSALKHAQNKEYGPMSKEKIKANYSKLYFLLVNSEHMEDFKKDDS